MFICFLQFCFNTLFFPISRLSLPPTNARTKIDSPSLVPFVFYFFRKMFCFPQNEYLFKSLNTFLIQVFFKTLSIILFFFFFLCELFFLFRKIQLFSFFPTCCVRHIWFTFSNFFDMFFGICSHCLKFVSFLLHFSIFQFFLKKIIFACYHLVFGIFVFFLHFLFDFVFECVFFSAF